MAAKQYNILLDETNIGTTVFEKADAPMGVVFGRISFNDVSYVYSFFTAYCLQKSITFTNYTEDKLIATATIPNLKVFNLSGDEIVGQGCSISGMDSENFEITIVGIPYLFYEVEFVQHVEAYKSK